MCLMGKVGWRGGAVGLTSSMRKILSSYICRREPSRDEVRLFAVEECG